MPYSDRQIEADVVDQLQRDDRLAAAGIRVAVNDGEVTLSGTVPTYSARETARSDTWMIPGVRRVFDRLEVQQAAALPADRVIERNVRNLLLWNPDLGNARLLVSCREGRVTLQGVVDAPWKVRRAEELAAYVVGVREVLNRLTVEPDV